MVNLAKPGYLIPLAVVAALAGACPAEAATAVTPTTPKGITLVDVVRELEYSQPEFLWIRPGDAQGRTLFTSDDDAPGLSNCVAACVEQWIPLAVADGAKVVGDWSIIKRTDGAAQWAYRSKPVYSWVKEKVPGDVATGVAVDEVSSSKLAQKILALDPLRPPSGWKVVRFQPSIKETLPDGIDVRVNAAAQGVTLTDFDGLTLYAFDGDAKRDNQTCSSSGCFTQWTPLWAPSLATGVADFSIVSRKDGTRQWAYNKKPLYRYKVDKLPGDAFGVGLNTNWTVAMLTENFRPARVAISHREGYGDTLTVNGMTLYTGIAYESRWGGRNLRDGYRNMYYKGKRLGGDTCVGRECLAMWQPFRPGADAQSNGYWEVISRADGSKQWAYKGYALYTYAGDKAPGEMNGNDTYDSLITDGAKSGDSVKHASFLVEVNGRAGVYWHIAKP